ncbi:AMP-dependent synthetase/ligase [Aureibacter tunicatorum]|uniref:Long-chain acyl-CoA synthetase n=1 Tax=Aureibacter tunicatorum TaxID=866807 RepID=A0AAE4BR06_9BACT|nr:AMP-binding protein [Aureibacter tunicatorum]MDR6237280.1 long-chain acyl-CoA synthetase [Aureibacter tunicatorum]BDD06271.1 AMP-dependent synthetase [Aureibacter tunicatorum]
MEGNRTLIALFEDSVRNFADNPAFWEKRDGQYAATSYKELNELIRNCAAGLIQLGLKKGERTALIAEGQRNWLISELGILFAGGVNVPISVKINEPSELKFRLNHSGCRFAIASSFHLEKIRALREDLPELEKIIVMDDEIELMPGEMRFNELLSLGNSLNLSTPQQLEDRKSQVQENDFSNICYTSGTTSDPKGIILTHRNYTANVEQAAELMPNIEEYRTLLILPLDHSFAHTAGIYGIIVKGASMASVEIGKTAIDTLRNVPKNIREISPSFLLSVPALAKSFKYNIEREIVAKGKRTESFFRQAMKFAYKYNKEGWNKGSKCSLTDRIRYKVYDYFIFRKIRASFGPNLKFFIGGGALLDIELQKFFYAIGIPMFQGYGLSEASPIISANMPHKHKLGSSGYIVKNLKVKICDEQGKELPLGQTGEIVVKGENVMHGYWKNEKATAETIKDGWLHTGDMGYLDEDNFLYVRGRYKSLLINNDGEKYAPEAIEEAIEERSEYIKQIMLYNSQNPYTVALAYPDMEKLNRKLAEMNQSIHTEAGRNSAFNLIQEELELFKKGGKFENMFPEKWLPQSIGLLAEGFTEQNHFLNNTMKLRRHLVIEYYKNRIEKLYTPETRKLSNEDNINVLKKL